MTEFINNLEVLDDKYCNECTAKFTGKIIATETLHICRMINSNSHYDSLAKLFSSAPELLEALEKLVNCPVVEGMSASIRDHEISNGRECAYKNAKSAIAKAKGNQE